MTTPTTILVPYDFSEAAKEALKTARDLGAKLGHGLVLLHVYTVPIVVYPGIEPIAMPSLLDEVTKAASTAIQRVAAEAGGVGSLVRAGDPAEEILAAIEETKPALVCMGTHGRKGFARVMLGSVAEKVVRASAVPVLTVHAPPGSAE
jgi:nucleotide-binding universal stress UspA family protein